MALIFKIAWRNINRHRGKSLVIGLILFLGAIIMTVGNGVISGMEKGLSDGIISRFTGHLVLVSDKQQDNTVILTPLGKDVDVIAGYEKVKAALHKYNKIVKFLPAGRGFTLILNNDGDIGFALTLGINFNEYQKMFMENVKLVEGSFFSGDERGILISTGNRTRIYDENNFWLLPRNSPIVNKNLSPDALKNRAELDIRDNLVLMGSSTENTTMDIKIDVIGVMSYEYLDDYWKHFNIMDIESFREVFHYVTGEDASTDVPAEKKKILESDNLDNLFNDSLLENQSSNAKQYDLQSLVRKKTVKKTANIDSGAYNLVFVKLKEPADIEKSKAELNLILKKSRAEARAITWKEAVGQIADMAMIMKGAAIGFVFLIFFVAIIIIMNTLSMAALERVSEIGMMRAVGAQRVFISGMFFTETAIISLISGTFGIITGIGVIYFLNYLSITTENHIIQLLFGGRIFKPLVMPGDILTGIIELVIVTVLAAIYPLVVAKKIVPLDAIMRD